MSAYRHGFHALLYGVILLLLVPVARAQTKTQNSCFDCHRKLERRLAEPTRAFAEDIHAVRGLGCVGCHGGDPADPEETAMDPDKGFKGSLGRGDIPELCVSCHANAAFMKRFNPRPYIFSMAEFRTSVHGQKLAQGDKQVATCTSCHGLHGILAHKDPRSPVFHRNVPATCAKCHNPEYMKGYGIPTNQYELYKDSVHGKALLVKGDASAPACNDCHGNHGAVPPNTRDISLVCGNCHGREGELFAQSKVKQGLELEGKRGCVTCHGNHGVQPPNDTMISMGEGGVCGRCHEPGSAGEKATAVIVPRFHALKSGLSRADSLLHVAEIRGMETGAGRESMRQAEDQLVTTRVTLHSFDTRQITAVLNEADGFVRHATEQGLGALRDWRNRRIGMGLSLIVILAMIGLLVLKIRRVESS